MATRKQIAANRKNAKQATGPKTIAGKSASSRNAIKFGILCRNLFRLPWEDPMEFRSMSVCLFDELQPQGPREHFLVEHIFSLVWRLRRAAIADAGILLYRVRDIKGLGPKPYAKIIPTLKLPDDSGDGTASEVDWDPRGPGAEEPRWAEAPPPRPSIADIGQAHILDVQEGDVLSKVRRHETSLENSLNRAVRELERLQEKRIASMTPACSESSDPSAPDEPTQTGSDEKAA